LDPLFIWGADDRHVYNDTNYPWGCVCRIVTAIGVGSGVIVGPRHVLTASHIVDWNTNGAGTVEVHRAGPSVSAISAIVRVWYFTKIIPPGVDWSEVDEDYAVLITADRIGDRFGWLGVRTYRSRWDDEPYWENIGYADDVAGQMFPIHQRDKELDEDEFDYGSGRSMTTSADTLKGQSGSPLFAFWADGPYVVAVVSAQGTYFLSGDENWCSGGSQMTRLVNHARSNDP
jgi:V8-like Glu-specific endopeptidase